MNKQEAEGINITTEFDKDDLLTVIDTYPKNHPTYIAALQQMIDSLTEEDKEQFQQEAMSVLGNPEPDGYSTDGQPIFTSETIARCTGDSIEEVEAFRQEHERLFGKVEVDEKITVLKNPEVEYHLSSVGVIYLALVEWGEGNKRVQDMLVLWFELAVERGLKPIVIEQLKLIINKPGWNGKSAERYLNRIYKYTTAEEFVTDVMGLRFE